MAEWLKAAVLKIAFRVTGTGVRIPLPPPFSKWLIYFDSNLKSDRITLKPINLRRGAGVVDQGRLLSDCLDYVGTVGSNPTLSANDTPSNLYTFHSKVRGFEKLLFSPDKPVIAIQAHVLYFFYAFFRMAAFIQ